MARSGDVAESNKPSAVGEPVRDSPPHRALRPTRRPRPYPRRVEPRGASSGCGDTHAGRAVGIERGRRRRTRARRARGGAVRRRAQAPPERMPRCVPRILRSTTSRPRRRGDATARARGGGAGEHVEHALFAAAGGAGACRRCRDGAERGRARTRGGSRESVPRRVAARRRVDVRGHVRRVAMTPSSPLCARPSPPGRVRSRRPSRRRSPRKRLLLARPASQVVGRIMPPSVPSRSMPR